ncbi:hypothetical protein BGZ94_008138 [Podila epigama]|nr:hypothetical protein BGZ94_008138 [Podila epigama]
MLFQEVRAQDWNYPGFIILFQKHLPEVIKLEWRKSRREARRRYREMLNALPPRLEEDEHDLDEDTTTYSMDQMCLADLSSILDRERTTRLRMLVIQGEMNLSRFLSTILPLLPNLTCLKIEDCFSWQKVGIKTILNCCQSLQSLDCDSSVTLQFTEQQGLIPTNKDGTISSSHDSTVRKKLLVDNSMRMHSNSSGPAMDSIEHPHRPPTPYTLKILRLHKTSLSDLELLGLLQDCPQLKELYLHQQSGLAGGVPVSTTTATHQWNWSEAFATRLAEACPKLVYLHLSPGCFQSLPEDILQRVLMAFPQLQGLGVPFSKFGDETMDLILATRIRPLDDEHGDEEEREGERRDLSSQRGHMDIGRFSSLTSLDLSNLKGPRLSSRKILQFLESCSTLVHFWGDPYLIHVEDMLDHQKGIAYTKGDHNDDSKHEIQLRPWACQRLETFVAGFQMTGKAGSALLSIHDAERAIYQQLGQCCKRLRRLDILNEAPSFSLQAGLDQLASLTVLQSYRVTRWATHRGATMTEDWEMDPSIVEALEWIARTWTCLQELHVPREGLARSGGRNYIAHGASTTNPILQRLRLSGRTNIDIYAIDNKV